MNTIILPQLKMNSIPLIQDLNYYADPDFTPKFFIAILAGVLLALVFQLLLTALSVAIGITAIGDVKKHYAKSRKPSSGTMTENNNEEDGFDQDYGSGTNFGVKVTTGFGLWSSLTTCLSLFAATAIAIRLSLFNYDGIAVSLGLVVWALFFIILFYLEFRLANTVVGGLINTAMSGIRSSAASVKNMFAPSDQQKMDKVITKTVQKIRDEFEDAIDGNQLNKTLDQFFQKVDKKLPDYDELVKDLEGIAQKSKSKHTAGKWMAIQQVLTKAINERDGNSDGSQQGKLAQLKTLASTIQKRYNEGNTPYEGIVNILTSLTPAERETVERHMETFKSYLNSSGEKDFSAEAIKNKLGKIFNDPSMLKTAFENNVTELNKQSIVEYLNQNTNLEKEKIQGYADTIESQMNSIRDKYNQTSNIDLKAVAEDRIRTFLDGTGRPEIRYDALQSDFENIMNNPKQSLAVLRNRLDRTDRNTLKALVTSNKYVSEENFDSIAEQFEKAKMSASDKLMRVQNEVNSKVELIKRKAVIQAEHSRKTAASAAWWLVITAILSAGAAIGGSLVSF